MVIMKKYEQNISMMKLYFIVECGKMFLLFIYLFLPGYVCPCRMTPLATSTLLLRVAEKYLDIPKMFDADGTTSWRIQCDSMFQIVKIKWFNGSFCLSTNFFLCSALDYIGDAPPETLDYISFSSALYGDSDL